MRSYLNVYPGDVAPRRGDWLQTYSGRKFYPADPRPEDVHIEDIAAALSKMCRYGGHCQTFYSVAEHSVHVANAAPAPLKLAALLHDASEAYLVDVPRPVKKSLPDYLAVEARLEAVIAERFGLPHPMPAEIKRLDNAILADERAQLMAPMAVGDAEWGLTEPPFGVTLRCWSPVEARENFLRSYFVFR